MFQLKFRMGLSLAVLLSFAALIFIFRSPAAKAFDNAHWGAGYFPNTELITQNGKKVRFYDDLVRGKIVVIDLIYTHCVDSCPLETARLAQVQKLLGDAVDKQIFFYSITIDPEHDTPAVLKEYAEKYHAGPGWLFLTGKKEDIDQLSKKIGLYTEPDPNDRDGHSPSVLIGSEPTGQWMRNGATDNPRFLATLIGDWLNNWKYSATQKQTTSADLKPVKLNPGQYVFASHCAACHTVGHGDKIGPDLLGVTTARNQSWLKRFIQEPDKVIAEKDPTALALFKQYKQVRMPNLRLADGDVMAILKFLQEESGAHRETQSQDQSTEGLRRSTDGLRRQVANRNR
ncbi:MAG TPA: SCO family protein [Candidatus Angelobacter sp.]|jgi:protein SCO1/2